MQEAASPADDLRQSILRVVGDHGNGLMLSDLHQALQPVLQELAALCKLVAPPNRLERGLSPKHVAAALGVDTRSLRRLRIEGTVPPADFHIKDRPRWYERTIRDWIERGGSVAAGL